jgi:hypothetical protein
MKKSPRVVFPNFASYSHRGYHLPCIIDYEHVVHDSRLGNRTAWTIIHYQVTLCPCDLKPRND